MQAMNPSSEVGRQLQADLSGVSAGVSAGEFSEAVLRNLPMLHRKALRYLKNVADAEDAVQDALLSAYKHRGQFRGQAAISTWLTAIVINAARMQQRRRRAIYVSLEEPHGEEGLALSEQLPDPRPDPEEVCAASESLGLLLRVANQLSPRLRSALQLRHIRGLTTKQIACLLRIPEGTVKSQVARARSNLARLIRAKHRRQYARTSPTVLALQRNQSATEQVCP
jgi:RNA polymerase sigma-70 factor, ECF subfamily